MSHLVKTSLLMPIVSLVCLFGTETETRACSTYLKPVPIRFVRDEPEWLVKKHVLLYEHLTQRIAVDPLELDRRNPRLFETLTNPDKMEQTVKRWEAHESRFDLWHPALWGVLDGYVHEPHLVSQPLIYPPGPGDLPGLKPGSTGIETEPSDKNGGPITNPSGGHHHDGGGLPQAAVPEPPAFFLMLSGMILAGLGAARRFVWDHAVRAALIRRQ